jgi:tetratricopeptide (TPR) repeat protein
VPASASVSDSDSASASVSASVSVSDSASVSVSVSASVSVSVSVSASASASVSASASRSVSRSVSASALIALAAVAGLAGCPRPRPAPLAPLPPEATAAYLRGRTAFYSGDYAVAIPELARAMVAAPDQAGIAIAHAQAVGRAGRRADARQAIDRVVVRFPDSLEAWLTAGELRARAGDAVDAIAAFRRALALDGGAVRAYLGLAAAQTQAGRAEDAVATYRTLVARVPTAAVGHWQLARLALARGDDAAAAPALAQVRALDRDHLDARRALAALLARAGRWDEALAEARASLTHSGGDLALAEDLVWLSLEMGDRLGALAILSGYDDAPDPEVRAAVAALYLAIGALDRARAVAPMTPDGRLIAAEAERARGRPDRAAALAAAVPGDAPQAAAAAALLDALTLDVDAPPPGAVAAATVRAPQAAALVAAAAERLRRGGAIGDARARFVTAARVRPHDAALATAWAWFEVEVGEVARAGRLAARILAAAPRDPGALLLAGEVALAAGRPAQAAPHLSTARKAAPGDPLILAAWGWYRRATGQLALADRALRRALVIAPHQPIVVERAAVVAAEIGDPVRAAALWSRVTDLPAGPEAHARARDHLARLAIAPCYAARVMTMPWLVRIVLGSALATAACSDGPSKADCEKLLEHLINLEAGSGGAAGGADKATKEQLDALKAELDKQKLAIKEYAVGQKFLQTCTQKTPRKVVACGLEAKNADELAACDK